jgi:predicted RND superfamily exporter protein
MEELIAWLWWNGDPAEVEALGDRLAPARVESTMDEAIERVATSLDGGELVMSSIDPFGFLGHPALAAFFERREGSGEGFQNAEGSAQLMFIDAPPDVAGYREAAAWLGRVEAVVGPWAEEHQLRVGYTGEPVFEAEVGGAMEGDMRGTLGLTALLIAGLFLLMQRRGLLLAGLGVVLAVVIFATMGVAGWIYGDLSMMAAGFAAILMGLAVDYGVLICQEAKVSGHGERAITAAVSRSILFAAATTAAVFFALNGSALPGIAQLGTIVGIGVVLGALFMLGWFLPWVSRVGAGRTNRGLSNRWLPGRRGARRLAVGMAVAALGVLAFGGLPRVEFERSLLRPRGSAAMATFERIQALFPAWGAPAIRVVVEGETNDQVRERLDAFQDRLQTLESEQPGLVEAVDLPTGWWPDPQQQARNLEALKRLGSARERLVAAADGAGFSAEGTALGRAVLGSFAALDGRERDWLPQGRASREILRTMALPAAEGGGYVLGTLEVRDREKLDSEALAALRTLSGPGIHLAGWDLLRPAVLPLVRSDLLKVFAPMVGIMLLMLWLVFRRWRDVFTALAAMALSGLLLLALMSALGLDWNFLNIAATPLLLGTGLDYAIHILLALRRADGDVATVWNGTGKAVLFCGGSTAIGFGSLGLASIDALASLGQVAVLGILSSMIVAVVIVPGLRGRR